jgi:predicted lipid-binding transport protein (Tim44 family)
MAAACRGTYIGARGDIWMTKPFKRALPTAAILLVLTSLAMTPADARRGGSFGSRGSRTYSAPAQSYGSTRYVPPIQRSMTPRTAAPVTPSYNPGFGSSQPRTGGRFGGFGGGLLGGLVAGGLIGHLLGGGGGHPWGGASHGGGGLLISLIQIAILGGVAWFVIGWFRRRNPVPAQYPHDFRQDKGFGGSDAQSSPWGAGSVAQSGGGTTEISLSSADQDAFERLLVEVQDAFGREDYARLRTLTTPEMMSFLSEELSQNATQGMRNEVRNTRLVDAEVAEAWREASGDYATVSLSYESVDVMRNRATGEVVGGFDGLSTATELWTFVRSGGQAWKLSAIQEL